jgi:DNA helicase-2/ATP-dependent DNA helicase PcrA
VSEQARELELTAEQNAVVDHRQGPLLVMAPVGSGKTTVLARRLAAAVASGNDPARCLTMTFTNRAARELKSRLSAMQPPLETGTVSTFHGFCAALLREECDSAGLSNRFQICDDVESEYLLDRLRPSDLPPESKALSFFYRWGNAVSDITMEECHLNRFPASFLKKWKDYELKWLKAYVAELRQRDTVDFPLLVYTVRGLLEDDRGLRDRWSQRFDWIQVDEVQDTHLSEWHLLEVLADRHSNLALFGDLDQTIYGWRGSKPRQLLDRFKNRFGEPATISLDTNQRGTRQILELADHIALGLPQRHTRIRPAAHLEAGQDARWILSDSPLAAAEALSDAIASILREDGKASIAVLARFNKSCKQAAELMRKRGQNPLLEDDLKLGRKPDVRAMQGLLRLAAGKGDTAGFGQLLRYCGRTHEQSQALAELMPLRQKLLMEPSDLLERDTQQSGDPFFGMLDSWESSDYVVLDVESTGLDSASDEVIEIACQRWSRDIELDRLHLLLRPSVDPSASYHIHGIDPELLAREGMDPAEAFRELRDYIGDSRVVGHNITFDLSIIQAHASRLAVNIPDWKWSDTLLLARRSLRSGSMKLGDLAERLQLQSRPTHRAMDDVTTTAELFQRLIMEYIDSRGDRVDFCRRHASSFSKWEARITRLREYARVMGAGELARHISDQDWFGDEPGRTSSSLRRFMNWIDQQEAEEGLVPGQMEALTRVMHRSALNLASDALQESGIPVITVHASKGMEFDHVFVYGLVQDAFPGRKYTADSLTEERRLVYVAITRARKRFTGIAWSRDERGRTAGWSEFVRDLT